MANEINPEKFNRSRREFRAGRGGDDDFINYKVKGEREKKLKEEHQMALIRERKVNITTRKIQPVKEMKYQESVEKMGKNYVLTKKSKWTRKKFARGYDTTVEKYNIYRKGNKKASYSFDTLTKALNAFNELEKYGQLIVKRPYHGQVIGR